MVVEKVLDGDWERHVEDIWMLASSLLSFSCIYSLRYHRRFRAKENAKSRDCFDQAVANGRDCLQKYSFPLLPTSHIAALYPVQPRFNHA
jgi:hypothetical protein